VAKTALKYINLTALKRSVEITVIRFPRIAQNKITTDQHYAHGRFHLAVNDCYAIFYQGFIGKWKCVSILSLLAHKWCHFKLSCSFFSLHLSYVDFKWMSARRATILFKMQDVPGFLLSRSHTLHVHTICNTFYQLYNNQAISIFPSPVPIIPLDWRSILKAESAWEQQQHKVM